MQDLNNTSRRLSRRWIATTTGFLASAVFVAVQLPAAREAVGAAKATYGFVASAAPSLGVAGIWLGFALLLAGAVGAWQLGLLLKEGTTKMMAVGSAVLVMAVGGLIAVEATLGRHGASTGGSYEAKAAPTHHASKHRRRSRRYVHRPTQGGSNPSSTATSPSGKLTPPSAPPASASTAPAPSSPPPSSGSSSSGSGGNGNTVTVNKNNHQEASSGNASGEKAQSGAATNNNNEAPVNISIG